MKSCIRCGPPLRMTSIWAAYSLRIAPLRMALGVRYSSLLKLRMFPRPCIRRGYSASDGRLPAEPCANYVRVGFSLARPRIRRELVRLGWPAPWRVFVANNIRFGCRGRVARGLRLIQ